MALSFRRVCWPIGTVSTTPPCPPRCIVYSLHGGALPQCPDGRTVPLAQSLLRSVSSAAQRYFHRFAQRGLQLRHRAQLLRPVSPWRSHRSPRLPIISSSITSSTRSAGLAYRKPFRDIKLFGQHPQLGAWYEAAGLISPCNMAKRAERLARHLFDSPLGVVTFAVGRTSDHQTRGGSTLADRESSDHRGTISSIV